MNKLNFAAAATLAIAGLAVEAPAQAHHYYHHYYHHNYTNHGDPGHGNCLRFNKTTGTVAGGVGGALLGRAIFGGTVGTVAGAAAGGLAGHTLARNGRKRC